MAPYSGNGGKCIFCPKHDFLLHAIKSLYANSYCAKEDLCFWHFSLASSWGIYLLHYVVFSLLGIYMDNICPDALGAKKPPFYFLVPSYWGFGIATVEDKVEKIKGKDGEILNESTDKDVLEEERVSQERMKEQTTSSEFVIDVRGLQQRFERKEKGPGDWFPKKKEFYAVKAPWYGIGRCNPAPSLMRHKRFPGESVFAVY